MHFGGAHGGPIGEFNRKDLFDDGADVELCGCLLDMTNHDWFAGKD